jgi:hypothetical protein
MPWAGIGSGRRIGGVRNVARRAELNRRVGDASVRNRRAVLQLLRDAFRQQATSIII